jgi:hypothetical protein
MAGRYSAADVRALRRPRDVTLSFVMLGLDPSICRLRDRVGVGRVKEPTGYARVR